MTPAEMISSLDRALAQYGEDVTLRRSTWVEGVATHMDAGIRAKVTGYLPDELVGGIVQGDRKVILSPTGIAAEAWPAADATVDERMPQVGDVVISAGRAYRVMAPNPLRAGGEVVRIELQVRG